MWLEAVWRQGWVGWGGAGGEWGWDWEENMGGP